jgi:hypothetical protein
MSVAANVHDLREVEAFYKRWGPDVFVFCRLFLGDEPQAETVSSKAFLGFYRESSELPLTGEVPPRLVGSALQAMQPCRDGTASSPQSGSLEKCILHLDCKQRSVFIARNVLGMTWSGIAIATNFPLEEVRQFWLSGMLQVRELLPRDFFER